MHIFSSLNAAVRRPFKSRPAARARARDAVFAMVVLVFLLSTTRYHPPEIAINEFTQTDLRIYRAIAEAAPELPRDRFPVHGAMRFLPSYLLGITARSVGANVDDAFRFVAAVLVLLAAFATGRIASHLGIAQPYHALAVSFAMLHAAAFRYYLAVPHMLPDLVFIAGLSAGLLGLVSGSTAVVLAGWVCASIARQTALPLLPVLVTWLAVGPGWRGRPASTRVLLASLATVIFVGAQLLSLRLASDISTPTDLSRFAFGLIRYVGDWPPGALFALFDLVARPLAALLPFLTFVLLHPLVRPSRQVDAALLLASALAIVAQPLASGPLVNMGNHVRLANLAVVPLILGAVCFLRPLPLRSKVVVSIIGVIMLASFHHRWTSIGITLLREPAAFLGLQLAASASMACLLWSARRASRVAAGELEVR